MPNIKSANNSHSRKILHPHVNNQSRTCKCINKTDYPLTEKCLSESALYQAGISSESFWVTIYHGISKQNLKPDIKRTIKNPSTKKSTKMTRNYATIEWSLEN